MKILVVDDNREICEMIETILASEGYDSVSCPNPLIAGAMIKKVRPKILITDILMSGLDGRNLVKELRGTKEGKKLKIIMISANLESIFFQKVFRDSTFFFCFHRFFYRCRL